MRAWVVLLLLAPAAAAQGGQTVERDGWTEFVPEWRAGPAEIVWQARNVSVAEGVSYATDGSNWLYGSSEPLDALSAPHACDFDDAATAVVLSPSTCSLARHPSIACAGTDLCDAGIGQTRPFGPAPRGHTIAREGWAQFVPWWREGPGEVWYQDKMRPVPEGVTFATDGGTFLYGSNESAEVLQGEHDCPSPWMEATVVLLHAATCTMALHPGVACYASDVCALGREPLAPTDGAVSPATLPREPTPSFDPADSCAAVRYARCTPAAPLGLVVFVVVCAAIGCASRRV